MPIKNHKSGIYMILSKANNKVYVGQSSSLTTRWKYHKWELVNNKHKNRHLQKAFNIYGLENFEYKILEYCEEDTINEREKYWIAHYESTDAKYGYNFQSGGRESNKGKTFSEETRLKMSKSQKGRKLTEEHKRKLSISKKGTHRDDETKEKIGKYQKGKPKFNKVYPTKEMIKDVSEYITFKEFSKKYKTSEAWRRIREDIGISGKIKNKCIRITASPEMVDDVKNGISRRKFAEKYGSERVWTRLRNGL